MIWILAARGAATRLRAEPFTETPVPGVHSVVYRPGIEPVPATGEDESQGPEGTFHRGLHRVSGVLFSYHGSAAETLLGMAEAIDLLIRYRANGGRRVRTLHDVLFVGDAAVSVPSLNEGLPELIGVPFRLQMPAGSTLAEHITDEEEA